MLLVRRIHDGPDPVAGCPRMRNRDESTNDVLTAGTSINTPDLYRGLPCAADGPAALA